MSFSQVKDKEKINTNKNMAKKPAELNKVVQTLNPKNLEKSNSKALNFPKFFKKYQTAIVSFALVLVLLVGGSLAYLRISNDQRNNASAGLNCPGGYSPSGSQCVATAEKIATTTYTCSDGTQSTITCSGHGSVDTVTNNNSNGSFYSGTKPVLFVFIPGNGSAYGPVCPNNYSYVDGNDGKIYLADTSVVCFRNDTLDSVVNNNSNGSFYSGTKPVLFVFIPGNGSAYGPVCPNNYSYVDGNDGKIYLADTSVVCFRNDTLDSVVNNNSNGSFYSGTKPVLFVFIPGNGSAYGPVCPNNYSYVDGNDGKIYLADTSVVCFNNSNGAVSQSTTYSCPDASWTDAGANCTKTISPTSYTPTTGNITNIFCRSGSTTGTITTTFIENTNAYCTVQATGAPTGVPYDTATSIQLKLNNSNVATCSTTGTTEYTCGEFSVGPTTNNSNTNKTVTTDLGGSLGITVTPAITEITNSDISSITCTTPVASGATITCTANFTANKSGTVSFTSSPDIDASSTATGCTTGAIAATDTSKSCTFTAKTVDSDTTSTVTGNASGGGSNPKTTQVTVTTNLITITNDNLADALEDCTDKTVASNGTYNCTFALEAGYKFPATGDFKAATSTTDNGTTAQATISPNCTYTANATTGNLTCNAIPAPTNNTTDSLNREILLRLGATGNYTDKGDVTITAGLSEIIFIPQSALTETPNPTTGLKVFGTTDYTLVLKDDRLVEGGKTATCDFRMKEVTAVDGATDTVNVALGYNNVTATTASIVALNNGGSLTTDAQKYFRVNYNSTTTNTGVSIKFPLAKQIRTDYNIQIRCKRSDNQEFARDQKVNFKFGAYSLVTVGAEQV